MSAGAGGGVPRPSALVARDLAAVKGLVAACYDRLAVCEAAVLGLHPSGLFPEEYVIGTWASVAEGLEEAERLSRDARRAIGSVREGEGSE